MRKNILFVGTLLCATVFSGCTVTSEVTTYGLFESTIKEVIQDLENEGYHFVKITKDADHNPHHAPTHYVNNPQHGFPGAFNYDFVFSDAYSFANDEGETLDFTVFYRKSADPSTMTEFVREVYTDGCLSSNDKHQERLCGESSPIHKLDTLPKNTTVRH
jgi:hypothetical protein